MRTLKPRSHVSTNVATINLRAYPNENHKQTPPATLQSNLFGTTIDAGSENRRRFGRALSMDRIEVALRLAHQGSMSEITDILAETVDTDPHLGSILNKRFGSIAALPYEVQPASGVGIDREKAMFYAEVARIQLRNLKSFRTNVSQLAWALFNGRACLEKMWIQIAPGVGPSHPRFGSPVLALLDLEWIHPRRLTFGPRRELRIQPENMTARGSFSSEGLTPLDMPDKFIWWTPQLFNEYPEREGLGIRCMYWSFFKRFAARERMILTELYGKPWRIVTVDAESQAGADELAAADKLVDSLGSSHTARMPRGVKLDVVSPVKSAGDVHGDVIKESDAQNSKLVLGQTGTTDGVASGLNNSQANVMQDEQLGVLMRDAGMMGELFETMLTDRIIALNFGESEVTHAPTFRFRADLPADRKAELGRLTAALDAGLSIQRSEAYEISGFSMPDPTDIVIRNEQPPTPANSPVAPAVRPVFIYPAGITPDLGQQLPFTPVVPLEVSKMDTSSAQVGVVDSAKTITVNEDRASRGLGPLTLPDGSPDDRGLMTVEEFGKLIGSLYVATEPLGTGPARPVGPASVSALPGIDPGIADVVAGIAATRRVALDFDINDEVEEGDRPFGDGGMHLHVVSREREETELDGRHMHVYKISGQYVSTLLDGDHMHSLASSSAEATLQDGKHQHSIILPSGAATVVSAEGSPHAHSLQVATTDVGGPHVHRLQMVDPSAPDGFTEVTSMTPAEFAADLAQGLVPSTFIAAMDQLAAHSLAPMFVATSRRVTRELDEVRSIKLEASPVTVNGSPDDLTNKAVRELLVQTREWATAFESAVGDQTTVFGAYNAMVRARANLQISKFGRTLERSKVHCLMLGVLDSVSEIADLADAPDLAAVEKSTDGATELGESLAKVGLTRVSLSKIVLASTPFSKSPFKDALATFKELKLLDKASFERATAAVKQSAFTVAGVVGDQMLEVLRADLFESIKAGEDLRRYKQRILPRLQDAGFVSNIGDLKTGQRALNASHIETVYRTNTMNTYNTGRYVHQSSPSVVSAFPVWEIRGVKDTRTRDTHLATHGVRLLANDPFWKTAYPPFGWNCRCRVIPRTKKYLDSVSSSSTIEGIPDTGFTSGRGAMSLG